MPGGTAGAARRPWRERRAPALALLCAAQFMVVLDTTIVNVALPSIQQELRFASQADLQYVVSLYALTFGGFLVFAGRVADLFGRRRLFGLGLLVFTLASLVCGLAPTATVLLVGRTLQGLGSAMVSPAALALLTMRFPEGRERNRALGVWGAAGGAAGATGLILGGVLTAGLGWEWVFFINLPVGVAAMIAAPRLLPSGRVPDVDRRLDLGGALSITLALGLLVFAFSRSADAGFLDGTTIALFAGVIVFLVVFVVVERRVANPVVAFRLFRLPGVTGANVTALLLNTVIASHLFFTTLYVQRVLGFSAFETGLAFLPNSALVLVGSSIGSRLAAKAGLNRLLAVALGIIGVSAVLLSGVSVDGTYAVTVLPGFALAGLGLGIAFVAVTIGATAGVEQRLQGLASGIVNSAQQVGFAVGIAAVVSAAMAMGGATGDADTGSLVASYSAGYVIDAVLAAVAAVAALFLVRGRSSAETGAGARKAG
ncbi:MFS transporter [Amycolatopsis sp. NPDC059021]|uniref:MFS transporter n=1 Tax=Amycolatopsis sp. NPDC059021 TaxID=3346704 RepID=UPI0036724392